MKAATVVLAVTVATVAGMGAVGAMIVAHAVIVAIAETVAAVTIADRAEIAATVVPGVNAKAVMTRAPRPSSLRRS